MALRLFMFSVFIQIPVAFYQFIRNPTGVDTVEGTLGKGFSNSFGYWQALGLFVLLGQFSHRRFPARRPESRYSILR